MTTNNYHMDIELFKKYGYKVIDEITDYYKHLEDYPVTPKVNFGDILDKLPIKPPEHGEPFENIIDDVKMEIDF